MKFVLTVLLIAIYSSTQAQTLVFAQLTGSPTMNTTGWNLTGAAAIGDTGGDADSNSDEMILTPNSNGSSGGAFFNTPIDLATCLQWNVDFYFRINDGNGADGIAFCFLDVPPTGFVSGGGVGIPSTANGIKVVFDTYDNGCGANPEIQIYNGAGYNECAAGIVKVNNSGGNLNFIRSNAYNHAIISYNNGTISVTVNNVLWLTTSYTVSFVGYMGFTASTGGSNDRHSIKNAKIFADIAVANAGPDIAICSGATGQIGTTNNSQYVYSWTPTTGLSSANVSNPSVSLTNSGTTPITQTFTVSTTLASNPNSCPVTDEVVVTVKPILTNTITTTVCQGNSYTIGGQTFSNSGTYSVTVNGSNGCDSVITLNLTVSPPLMGYINASICQGGSYTFGNQVLTTAGNYQRPLVNANGCDSIVVLTLSVNPPLTSTINASICPGESYNFLGLTLSSPGTYTQQLQTPQGCDSIITLNLSVKQILTSSSNQAICQGSTYNFNGQVLTTSGTYTATLLGSYGCDSIVSVVLTVHPIPAAPSLSSNSPLNCPGDELTLNAQVVNNGTIAWTGPSNFSSAQYSNTFNCFVPNEGTYSATVTVNNCVSPPATIPVEITNKFSFEDYDFPNVLTPNGDNINDELDIENHFHTCYQFEVQYFNRWGNLVFSHKYGEAPFAGKSLNGSDLAEGVYFYKLDYEGKTKSGFVQLIR